MDWSDSTGTDATSASYFGGGSNLTLDPSPGTFFSEKPRTKPALPVYCEMNALWKSGEPGFDTEQF